MTDLTAEDRAALLAASMACAHALKAVWRAYDKLVEVEDRLGKTATDYGGTPILRRLVDIGLGANDFCLLMDMAVTDGRDVRWE